MGLRPGRCIREMRRPFTRFAHKVQRKNFLGGIPGIRTREFTMGDQTKEYNTQLDVIAKGSLQIRDNAVEAMRQKLVKKLNDAFGKDNFVLKLRLFPHQVIREHKAATGAGADRVSKGMKHAFGKNASRAIQVKKNDVFLSVVVDKTQTKTTEKILDSIRYKVFLPFAIKVHSHENKKLSGRKKWTRESKKQRIARESEEKGAAVKAAVTTAATSKAGEGKPTVEAGKTPAETKDAKGKGAKGGKGKKL